MKNIIITEEHKSKLIEMCKALFPETHYVHFCKDYERNNLSIENYDIGESWDDNKPQIIHNFQLKKKNCPQAST